MTAPQVLALLLHKFRVSVAGGLGPCCLPTAAFVVGGVGGGWEVACGSWVDGLGRGTEMGAGGVVLGMCVWHWVCG